MKQLASTWYSTYFFKMHLNDEEINQEHIVFDQL